MRKKYGFSKSRRNPYAGMLEKSGRAALKRIRAARKQAKAGKTISLEALRSRLERAR